MSRTWLVPLFAAVAFLAAAGDAGATPTVIRTGGPSAPTESKVAIVASDRNLSGSRFEVTTAAGRVVQRGRLRRARGFQEPWDHAWRATLKISRPGSYRVRVAGKVSRPWMIRPDGSSFLIPKLLRYMETNRDGNEPALLHDPAHLNDAMVVGHGQMDLTGGWMDAGDMIHFTQTTALVAEELQAAARLSPENAPALDSEADVGIRWLLKAHPAGSSIFIAQVGDERDHDLGFRDPANDAGSSLPGISKRIAWSAVGSDVAGKAATALALAADRGSSVAPAPELIERAKEWYDAGRAAAHPLRKLPEPSGGFYLEGTWRDDMATGAVALYRTTGEAAYLNQALSYLRTSRAENGFGWIDNQTFAAADLCGGLGAPALGTGAQRREACGQLADASRDALFNQRQDAFGMVGYLSWGTTAENSSFGSAAAIAANLGLNGRGGYAAASARDWMLGRNPWGASFVAGFGPKSPRHVHTWASVFGNGLPDGAVVGGPTPIRFIREEKLGLRDRSFFPFNSKRAIYEDRRDDYVTSEPAIDYAGASILLLASLDHLSKP